MAKKLTSNKFRSLDLGSLDQDLDRQRIPSYHPIAFQANIVNQTGKKGKKI